MRAKVSRVVRSLTAVVGTVLVVSACASGSGGTSPGTAPDPAGPGGFGTAPAGEGYLRHVAGIPVIDDAGRSVDQPFLGGFNIPRPQLIDIDADGDEDLFVQETSGSVMFFEHIAGADIPFQWRTDRYQDLEVGEWYRFVDLDRDGDHDLLAERPFSYLRYYRNDGTAAEARFVEAADTVRDTEGRAIFSDRQNIPNATDIDADGRMDLLIGRLEGTVTRYEETGTDENGVPRFELVTDRFEGIEIVAQIGSLHGANTMALGDIDADGDEDLFWGDYFEPGILLLENTGSPTRPNLRGEPLPFPTQAPIKTSGYNAPTVGDVDMDGDQDLLLGVLGGAYNPNTTTADNFHYIEQTQPGSFEHRTSRFISTIDFGAETIPVPVDLDGDGDLDLLVGNKIEQDDTQNGKLYRLVNEGSPTAPRFRFDGDVDVGGGYHLLPAFGDLDADGDLDAIVGTWSDQLRVYRNDATDGTLDLTFVDSTSVALSRGRNATPTLGDIDADGDLDLFVGESSGTLNFYENTGSASRAEFTLVSDEYGDFDVGRRSLPVLRDTDRDGDLDLLVGSEGEGVILFRNEGTPDAPSFVEAGPLDLDATSFAAPAFADLDGDGDDDVVLGTGGGGPWLYENRQR